MTETDFSSIFDFQDLSGTFSVLDVFLSLLLAFVLTSIIGVVYQKTHRNVSYSQSFVQTLVLVGMVIAVIMLVVGSNIARAFALVGALSVIRFRNAVKETRDVGFLFLAMAVGMTTGTRFYVLAIAATVIICSVMLIMYRFDWFRADIQRQVIKVQVPADGVDDSGNSPSEAVEMILAANCTSFEMISAESVRGGALTEYSYTAQMRKTVKPQELVSALRDVNYGQKATVLTGHDQTDV
ncbi:DUF4956 domain-containing protein [Corynebacterium alimapuense]|uniref:DUF4956 domain-containing protein n=1 Tax=Corynebacterium alimapuense TaxID=1576874 RepID=A0A3M8K4P8_9CORY|nr:DUF4956 domain-containing protein [Corynebacterium alimapuense]RNE48166.1 DUF4956 domain-containing protein [Corynebacterium alimapuense]